MNKLSLQDILNLDQRYRANLISSLSGFKGLQLVGTTNTQSQNNISIINSAHHLGATPPLMGYIQRPHSVERQTYENILETKKYTFSNVTHELMERAHQTSARYPREISEFDACQIQMELTENNIPFARESSIVIELDYVNSYHIKENDTILVIGQVNHLILDQSLLYDDGTIDLPKAQSLAGVGLNGYGEVGDLTRYAYAKPDKKAEKL